MSDKDVEATERLMRLAEQAEGLPGYGVSPAFLAQYEADLEAARAEGQSEIASLRADIAQAIGYCQGLGHPNSYLEKRHPDIASWRDGNGLTEL